MPGNLVKSALHLQQMKFGRLPDPTKNGIKYEVTNRLVLEDATKKNIEESGIRLSYSENRALFAVQFLLDETQYKGNDKPSGSLPRLRIPISKYLDAYGVRKNKTARGKLEYTSAARKDALDALQRLSEIHFLMLYTRKERKNKKISKDNIEIVCPLIQLSRKGREIVIIPCKALIDQIDEYYCWLPMDLYSLGGSNYLKIMFIEYLNYHFDIERKKRKNKNYEISLQLEQWAYKLHLDAYVKHRQWDRIRNKLTELYECGKTIGLISDYQVDQPGVTVEKLDIVKLNEKKFLEARSTGKSSKVYLSEEQSLPIPVARTS